MEKPKLIMDENKITFLKKIKPELPFLLNELKKLYKNNITFIKETKLREILRKEYPEKEKKEIKLLCRKLIKYLRVHRLVDIRISIKKDILKAKMDYESE